MRSSGQSMPWRSTRARRISALAAGVVVFVALIAVVAVSVLPALPDLTSLLAGAVNWLEATAEVVWEWVATTSAAISASIDSVLTAIDAWLKSVEDSLSGR